MNVFDLPGPEFLKLYVILLAGAVGALFILRYMLRGPFDDPAPGSQNLGAMETAYLGRGRRGAVDAAIAALAHRDVLKVKLDRTRPRVSTIGHLPDDATELETVVYDAAAGGGRTGLLLGPLRRAAAPVADRIADPMRRMDLLLPKGGGINMVRFAPVLPLLFCLLIGVQKIIVGSSRHKPIGYLVGLCIVTGIIMLAAIANYPHRTRRGDKLLAALRKRNASLDLSSAKQMTPAEVALAFGLFGPAVLAGSDQDLYTAMRNSANNSAGCGGGSCGSSGCGGGGGCGGGCGGCGGD